MKNLIISLNPQTNNYTLLEIPYVFFDATDAIVLAENIPADTITQLLYRLLHSLEEYTVEGLKYAE